MTLIEDYEARKAGCLKENKFWGRIAMTLYVMAFIASAAATMVAAAGGGPKELVVALAAAPGTFTAALTMFRPDARAQWWWAKYAKLDDLVQDMKHQNKTEAQASEELKKFLAEREPKYPGFGDVSSMPAA